MPLPPKVVRRIVLIGDTGCRLKASTNSWQACNDPAAWPFARVARAAAAMHPDLVLHVGDYHYRENACPSNMPGCSGSPWGYGWDAWDADFFRPAAPLLAAAPWILVRGNHEACDRAGQGWWLLLDPHPLDPAGACADPSADASGNHTNPYAVELGSGARIIVTDLSAMGEKHLRGAELERYSLDAAAVQALTVPGQTNFVSAHYPFAAVTFGGKKGLGIGLDPVRDAFHAGDRVPELPHVAAMLAGHIHMLQYAALRQAPAQIVTGFSGTEEDPALAPADLAALHLVPGGADIRDIVSRFGQFGFGLLERLANGRWRFSAYSVAG